MTHKEQVMRALNREPQNILPCHDSLWSVTVEKYRNEGFLKEGEDVVSHFDTSIRCGGWLNSVADMEFEDQIIEETDESRLVLNGNGAQFRSWKDHTGTPERVDFAVKERAAWEEQIKPHLLGVDHRRIPSDVYRDQKRMAAEQGRAFCWHGVAPFELIHPVCGHEYMLMGMALDPDWVKDMVQTYADFTIMHQEVLFEEEGIPDFVWYYEDMGFKGRPFMSPAMYEDIVQPGHAKLFDYAHSKGCKVLVHSCGFIEPLIPGMITAGMDCLQAMEVKAGMDLPRLAAEFADKIAFCGNIDIRILATNDRAKIDEELKRKILPVLDAGTGYILHSDHSIPPDVEYDTLKYFFDHGRRIGQ